MANELELQKEFVAKSLDYQHAKGKYEGRLSQQREKLETKKRYLASLYDEEFQLKQNLHHCQRECKELTQENSLLLEKFVELKTSYARTKADVEYRKMNALSAVEAGSMLIETQRQTMEQKRMEVIDAMNGLKELTHNMRELHRQFDKDLEANRSELFASLKSTKKLMNLISRRITEATTGHLAKEEEMVKEANKHAVKLVALERKRAEESITHDLLFVIRTLSAIQQSNEEKKRAKLREDSDTLNTKTIFADPDTSDYELMDRLLEAGLRNLRQSQLAAAGKKQIQIATAHDINAAGSDSLYSSRKDRMKESIANALAARQKQMATNGSAPSGVKTTRTTMIRHATMRSTAVANNGGIHGGVGGANAANEQLSSNRMSLHRGTQFGTSGKGTRLTTLTPTLSTTASLAPKLTAAEIISSLPQYNHRHLQDNSVEYWGVSATRAEGPFPRLGENSVDGSVASSVGLGGSLLELHSALHSSIHQGSNSSYQHSNNYEPASRSNQSRKGNQDTTTPSTASSRGMTKKLKKQAAQDALIMNSLEKIVSIVESLSAEFSSFDPDGLVTKRRMREGERELFVSKVIPIVELIAQLHGELGRMESLKHNIQRNAAKWACIIGLAKQDLRQLANENDTCNVDAQSPTHELKPSAIVAMGRPNSVAASKPSIKLNFVRSRAASQLYSAWRVNEAVKQQLPASQQAHNMHNENNSIADYCCQLTMESISLEEQLRKANESLQKYLIPFWVARNIPAQGITLIQASDADGKGANTEQSIANNLEANDTVESSAVDANQQEQIANNETEHQVDTKETEQPLIPDSTSTSAIMKINTSIPSFLERIYCSVVELRNASNELMRTLPEESVLDEQDESVILPWNNIISISNKIFISKLNQRFAHLTKEPRSKGVVFSEEEIPVPSLIGRHESEDEDF